MVDVIKQPGGRAEKRVLWCALSVVALGIAVFTFLATRPRLDSDPVAHRTMSTDARLAAYGYAIDMWVVGHGRAPSDQENLPVLGVKFVPDGWESPFVYKNLEHAGRGKFRLYSAGANGIDDNGSGDDIAYRPD